MEQWIATALKKEGKAEPGSVPRGEAGTLHCGGARYVALVCGTEVFQNTADRWPDAIDVASLAHYARALAACAATWLGLYCGPEPTVGGWPISEVATPLVEVCLKGA